MTNADRRYDDPLRPPLRCDRPDDLDQRQSGGHGELLRRRAAGRCRVGGLLPHGSPPEAARALFGHSRLDAVGHPPPVLDSGGVLFRGRRRRRDGGARAGSASTLRRSRQPAARLLGQCPHRLAPRHGPGRSARACDGLVGAARQAAAVRSAQDDHRGAAGRCLADAGRSRAGAGVRASGRHRRRQADGRLDALGRVVRVGAVPRDDHRRSVAAVSFLPGLSARGRSRRARGAFGLAARVEVGRHPRTARPARRRRASLVSRRGSHHAQISRDHGRGDAPSLRDRARRRGARLPGRPPAALLGPSAADRAPEAGGADGASGAGRVHGLRHPGTWRARHP